MPRSSLWLRFVATFALASGVAAAGVAETDIAAPDAAPAPVPEPGDRIGTIYFKISDIFDTSKPGENKALYRLANRLHIDTKEDALRSQLLFAEGDLYSQRVVDETARALRRLRYIREPRIRVVSRHDGLVDLEVSASDVWTLSPGISYGRKGGASHSSAEFEDFNLFGTGKRLSLGVKSDVDRTSKAFHYVDPNVLGSRWTTELGYSDNNDGNTLEFDLQRPFYSFDTRWTAGASFFDDDGVQHRYSLGKRADEYRRQMRDADMHFGTSEGWDNGWVRRFTVGMRLDERRFSDAAGYAPSAILPTDHRFSYPYAGVEFIQDDYATDVNVDQIERTEDFAFGRRFMAEVGYSNSIFGADESATLVRAEASRGWRLQPQHSLFLGASFSGRYEAGATRNSILSAAARYYWRTSPNTMFAASLSGDVGHALDLDNELTLGGDNGLRGYPLRYQTGNSRALLTLEERFYTNWYPFRLFHIGGAVFTDIGRSFGPSAIDVPNLGTLRDVGFGLRFSNSRSALANVLHLDVAFPLDGDSSIKNVQFLIETKRSF